MTKSGIEWTDRSDWNPMRGCTRVSEGCRNCYAERIAGRFSAPGQPFHGFTTQTPAGARWTGKVEMVPGRLDLPLRWRKPSRIFVNSAFDLFHESVPDAWIDQVFAVMALAQHHTFQVLTKRANRMRAYLTAARNSGGNPWDRWTEIAMGIGYSVPGYRGSGGAVARPIPNVWLGVSAEDQQRADERIPHLLATPAAVRWVSAEPLLGPVRLNSGWMRVYPRHCPDCGGQMDENDECPGWYGDEPLPRHPGIDWVIAGGESGPGARPSHPDWFRSLRDQCEAARMPFHFKQHGDWREWDHQSVTEEVDADGEMAAAILASAHRPAWITRDGRVFHRRQDLPEDVPCRLVERLGKTRSGRLLDGREHNGMPGHG